MLEVLSAKAKQISPQELNMKKTIIAKLERNLIKSLNIIDNQISCAQQMARPGAVSSEIPRETARQIYKEAIFSIADANSLEKEILQNIVKQYNVDIDKMDKLYVDYTPSELFIIED